MTGQPEPAKTNKSTILLLVAFFGILAYFGYMAIAMAGFSGEMSVAHPSIIPAKYIVSGSATAVRIIYTNEKHETEQVEVSLPWKKKLKVSPDAILVLYVQNLGTGSITCGLQLNNRPYTTSTSTARYGVVTCTNRLP